jgi:hypothetical protein
MYQWADLLSAGSTRSFQFPFPFEITPQALLVWHLQLFLTWIVITVFVYMYIVYMGYICVHIFPDRRYFVSFGFPFGLQMRHAI